MHTLWQRIVLVPVVTCFLLVSGAGDKRNRALAVEPCDQTPNPCFTNVSDILQGRRILLPVDDLVITLPSGNLLGAGVSNLVLQTTSSQITTQDFYPITGSPVPNVFATAMGRLLNLPRNIIVTMTEGLLNVQDYGHFGRGFTISGFPQGMVMADFNGNEFADIAVLTADGSDSTSGLLRIVAANDVNNIDAGLFVSDGVGPQSVNFADPISMTTGDFNGDGKPEVAIAQTLGGAGAQFVINIYEILTTQDGKIASQALRQAASVTFPSPGGNVIWSLNVVAGDYDGKVNPTTNFLNDKLVIVMNNGDQLTLQAFRVQASSTTPLTFDITLASTFVSSDTLYTNDNTAGDPLLTASGRLDWFTSAEQIVAAYTKIIDSTVVEDVVTVFTLDSNLTITQAASIDTGFENLGLAIGNFDEDLSPNSPPSLEIARVLGQRVQDPDRPQPYLEILKVDPTNNFALSVASSTTISGLLEFFDSQVPLVAGDTQGRSLLLGAPTKITATSTQPHLILAAPPMHVDYVKPSGSTQPTVLNLSAIPRAYYSSYSITDTNKDSSSHQGTTSYTNAGQVEISGGYKLDSIFEGSVTVTAGASAGYMDENFVKKQYDQYSSSSFDATTITGLSDQVWFTTETQNIYAFPVIGQFVCPEDKPNCTDSEKVPLMILFSGPTIAQSESAPGSILEWYQPVHEPGNILSYPRDLAQLQAREGDVDLLTSAQTYYTDSATTTATANWSGQTTTSVTSGNTNQITWSAWLSVVLKPPDVGSGAVGSLKASYNGSKTFSTLNTSTTTLGESTGIGIAKPGTFANPPEYAYAFTPYIMGDQPVPGTIQSVDLGTAVQTSGILRAQFIADPLDPNAGAWWAQAYPLPDVALAHPARWQEREVNGATTLNCLRISTTATPSNCITFNLPDSDIWQSEFHWMKGLLITPAEAPGLGPQINQATAGDQVLLQARVYNYSLKDMPEGSQIIVQFYAQPWDQSTLQPAGNAVLINHEGGTVQGLPGFGGSDPNWAVASTFFDTTPFADQYLAFWVLIVAKDAQGNWIAEMPGHGLTGVPPTLDSISDATGWLEPYSNNIGFYKSLFYVAPPDSTPDATLRAALTQAGLSMAPVTVSAEQVLPGDKVTISALLQSDTNFDGLSIAFYDGTPGQGGTLFDVEQISRIRANDAHLVKAVYRATSCGTHTLHLLGLNAEVSGQATVDVVIDPVTGVADLLHATKAAGLPRGIENSLIAKLQAAQQSFMRGNTTAGLDQLSAFRHQVTAQRGKQIPTETADALLAELDRIVGCIAT